MRVAAGAVQQEDGVIDVAGRVAVGRAQGQVVELELREGFAGAEAEVGEGDLAVGGGPFCGLGLGGELSLRGWSWRGHGHGLTVGGCGKKEGGGDGHLGDELGHVGLRGLAH